MANSKPSLWDDDDNDATAWDYVSDTAPAEEPAKQRSSGKKHKSWWEHLHAQPLAKGERRSKSKAIGFNYYDTFDDTDDFWYRKNSFQYSRAHDYSPSRQFRSFYSSSSIGYSTFGSHTASNELANKCLNAIRSLTRSANTIVDKKENANYLVQIKADAESVRIAQETDAQKKMVYVSSAGLAEAKTTDDEDRVIDELTGFVLLRVQLAEGNDPKIISEINATGLHGVTGKAVNAFFNARKKINPHVLTEEIVISYLAGLMSKAMLSRIARKDVIKNWGGFGPYFARHAEKFAAAEKQLKEQAADNTETVVSRIAFNLLNDEKPMPLGDTPKTAKDIENILAEYFEAEVAAENMLATSTVVVQKIHEYFKLKDPDAATGATGAALEESLRDLENHINADKEARKNIIENTIDAGKDFSHQCESAISTASEFAHSENIKAAEKLNELALELYATQEAIQRVKESMAPEVMALPTYSFDSKTKSDIRDMAGVDNSTPIPSRKSAEPEAAERFTKKAKNLLEALCEKQKEKIKEYKETARAAAKTYQIGAELLGKTIEARSKEASKLAEEYIKEIERTKIECEKSEITPEEKAKKERRIDSFSAAASIMHEQITANEYVKQALDGDRHVMQAAIEEAEERSDEVLASHSGRSYLIGEAERLRSYTVRLQQLAATIGRFDAGSDHTSAIKNALRRYHSLIRAEIQRAGSDVPAKRLKELAEHALDESYSDKSHKLESLSEFVKQMSDVDIGDSEKLAAAAEALEEMGLLRSRLETLAQYKADDTTAIKAIVAKIKEATKQAENSSTVDAALFEPDKIAALRASDAKTGLEDEVAALVNKEANSAQEEDFVSFLNSSDSDSARPTIRVIKPTEREYSLGARMVQNVIRNNKTAIQNIQNALIFQAGKRSVEEYGMISGDLDEGSLHKLGYDSEHVWTRKTMMRLPDVAVGLLIDQSGSMYGKKIEAAREMCIVLAAALQRIKGVRLYIYGHTANQGYSINDLDLYQHYHPDHGTKLSNLGTINAMANNYDGYALKEAARLVSVDPAKQKYMFVIADGFPAGNGYGGATARKHVTSVVKFLRERWRMHTYAFGVDLDCEKDFYEQYGKEHTVFVKNVRACQGKIVRFLKNVLQREKTLVDVAD